jgi:RNA polymerase sigma-70 factor (ECF subfamily)
MSVGLNRFLRSLDLSADEAEEVMQETFFRLTRQMHEGGRIERIEAWVFQVAHNLSMDVHRARRRGYSETFPVPEYTEEPADSRANPERALLEREKAARVRVAISRLTPRQFRSLQMRAQGQRYREIAAELGVSEQRAIHLVKRARLRLAEGA